MVSRKQNNTRKAAIRNWHKILVSKLFGSCSLDLWEWFVYFVKNLCITNIHTINGFKTSLEMFAVSWLILLNKNPGLHPIGVSEVLRRKAEQIVMEVTRKYVQQVCAGQDAEAGTAIHAMYDFYQQNEVEAVFFVDAENAFNAISRKAMLHNISITCPIISTFISDCCLVTARLF